MHLVRSPAYPVEVAPSRPARIRSFGPLPLRLLLGVGFMVHGFPRFFTLSGHESFASTLWQLGLPLPEFTAWTVAAAESCGGAMLFLGILTGIASVLLIVDMLAAMFLVHVSNGFSAVHVVGRSPAGPVLGTPGVELNLLYLAGLLSILITGPGRLSMGRGLLSLHRKRRMAQIRQRNRQ